MKNVNEIICSNSECDQAFADFYSTVKQLYDEFLSDNSLIGFDEDGIQLFYEHDYIACVTLALMHLKENNHNQYEMLCEEAGGEMKFVYQSLWH